jgi:hypothetical protein
MYTFLFGDTQEVLKKCGDVYGNTSPLFFVQPTYLTDSHCVFEKASLKGLDA